MSGATKHLVSETHCVGETIFFTWKICDYDVSPLKTKSFLLSDSFVFENTCFSLKAQYVYMNYNHSSSISSGYVLSVGLICNGTLPEVDFLYSISAKNCDNKNEHQDRFLVKRGQKPSSLYIVNEAKVSHSSGLLVDDCLTLSCKVVSLRTTHKSNSRQTQGTAVCSSRLDVLSRDLRCLFSSKEETDFVLTVEEQDIPVHSLILSARSSVFAAMFRNDFKEKRTGLINITDMGLSEINCLLEYIYTGEVPGLKELSSDSLVDLYAAAEKYDLKELKFMCSRVVQSNLSKDNIQKYASLAFTYGDQNIMAAVVALFGSNKDLIDSDLMHELAHKFPILPLQVLKFVTRGM